MGWTVGSTGNISSYVLAFGKYMYMRGSVHRQDSDRVSRLKGKSYHPLELLNEP